jgi:serine/threonine-protein kinase
MEFVDGRSLAEILYGRGKLEERTACHITRQVAKALSHAHRFSIVHRDIKPENIMISKDGLVKLCDLGLAKDLSLDFQQWGGITLGTVYYASPEQASGRKDLVDIRSDIYSLGISFYHMLAGKPPFNDSNIRKVADSHIHEELPSILQQVPEISPDTVKLLKKMTAKKIQERHQTPEELIEELDCALHGRNPPNPISLEKGKTPTAITPPLYPLLKKRKVSREIPHCGHILLGFGILMLLTWGLAWGISWLVRVLR